MKRPALLSFFVASLATSPIAWAQSDTTGDRSHDGPTSEASSDDEPVERAEVTETPLAVVVRGEGIDREAIVAAVLAELSTTLEPSSPRKLTVTIGEQDVVVLYEAPGREPVARRVDRPDGAAGTVEAVALLAGNLARDQAEALLASLERPAEPSTAPPEDMATDGVVPEPIVAPTSSPEPDPPDEAPTPSPDVDRPITAAQAAFVWPLAVFPDGEERTFGVDVSVLFGRSGGQRGLGLHVVGALVHGEQAGLVISGLWGYRGGSLAGVSLNGGVSASGGEVAKGVELAGVANLAIFGERPAALSGLQLAGIANAAGDVAGVQLAGASNVARNGGAVQLAGISNHAGDSSGVQLTGGVNTADTLRGVQIGLVNVARRVEGLQLGLVNVAEENDGTAVGLVNLAGDGDVQIATWAALSSLSNVGVKMRVGPLFVQPAFGYDPFGGHSVSGQTALGLHFPIEPIFVETVLGYGYDKPVAREEGTPEIELEGHHRTRLVGQVGVQVSESFGLFGGVGAVWDVTDSVENDRASVRPELTAGVLLF